MVLCCLHWVGLISCQAGSLSHSFGLFRSQWIEMSISTWWLILVKICPSDKVGTNCPLKVPAPWWERSPRCPGVPHFERLKLTEMNWGPLAPRKIQRKPSDLKPALQGWMAWGLPAVCHHELCTCLWAEISEERDTWHMHIQHIKLCTVCICSYTQKPELYVYLVMPLCLCNTWA